MYLLYFSTSLDVLKTDNYHSDWIRFFYDIIPLVYLYAINSVVLCDIFFDPKKNNLKTETKSIISILKLSLLLKKKEEEALAIIGMSWLTKNIRWLILAHIVGSDCPFWLNNWLNLLSCGNLGYNFN